MLALLGCVPTLDWDVGLNTENNAGAIRVCFHRQQDPLVAPSAQPSRLEQRHGRPAVLARHSSCPEICDGWLGDPARIALILQILLGKLIIQRVNVRRAVFLERHELHRLVLVGDMALFDRLEVGVGWIVCGKLPPGAIQHPLAPGANVPGEIGLELIRRLVGFLLKREANLIIARLPLPLRLLPEPVVQPLERRACFRLAVALGLLEELRHEGVVVQDELRQRASLPGQLLRVLQRALENEPGDRVDVHRRGLTPQPHRLQRNRPAAGERVEHPRRTTAVSLLYLLPEPLERLGVLRFPAPVKDAALGLFLDPLDRLAAGHLLLLDLPDDLAADLLA